MAHFLIPSLAEDAEPDDVAARAQRFFVETIAERAGLRTVRDASRTFVGNIALQREYTRARTLIDEGIATSITRARSLPDEPRINAWTIQLANKHKCGGISSTSDAEAVRAAVSEALERHIWMNEDDYFENVVTAPLRDM